MTVTDGDYRTLDSLAGTWARRTSNRYRLLVVWR